MLKKLIGFALLYALSNTPLGGVKFQESIFLHNNPLQQIEEKVEECYAEEVVRPGTNLVVNNYSALGKPDGEYTWVLPHGEITLKMSSPLYSLGFYIDGRVVAKEGIEYSVAVLVPHVNYKGETEQVWRIVTPTLISGGFDIPASPQVAVDTIKIKNLDYKRLYLDAVIGYCYVDEESRGLQGQERREK